VGYLHTHQPTIIFRDLKPANIILTPEEHLYLIDFGIARHFKPGQSKDTIAFGSPGYAAPEQYGKTQSPPRADIYSLGATLHHLVLSRYNKQPHLSHPRKPQSNGWIQATNFTKHSATKNHLQLMSKLFGLIPAMRIATM